MLCSQEYVNTASLGWQVQGLNRVSLTVKYVLIAPILILIFFAESRRTITCYVLEEQTLHNFKLKEGVQFANTCAKMASLRVLRVYRVRSLYLLVSREDTCFRFD